MLPSLQTRKPIDQLSPSDFDVFPVWEFALDEEENDEKDETWVRPVALKSIGPDLYSLSVAADFISATGQAVAGFVIVSTDETFEVSGGVLLHQGKYVCLPDAYSTEDSRHAIALAIGAAGASVFPFKFTLRVLVDGEHAFRNGEFE